MGHRLSGRRLRRLALAAVGLGAVVAVVLPASASMAPAQSTPSSYRLTLAPDDPGHVFTAELDRSVDGGRSWKGASGETLTFAFVGEGAVTAISGAGRGLSCTTSAAGTCTVTVESPGDSLLSASFEDLTANAPV
jgi:hypothetical protein